MSSILLIAIISAIFNLCVAIVVLARGIHKILNRVFVLLVLSIVVWIIVTGISNYTQDVNLSELYSRVSYGSSIAVIGLAYLFSMLQGNSSGKRSKRAFIITLVSMTVLGPVFSTGLVYNAISIDKFEYGPLVIPYYLVVAFGIAATLYELALTLKSGERDQRHQARSVVGALAVTMILIGLVNLVIPVVYKSETLTQYSPMLSMIFVTAVGYAITKHKLFDIRGIIVRTLAYGLTTVFMITVYVLLATLVKRIILPDVSLNGLQLVSNVILTVILVFAYPTLKKYFDKLTNKFFFRDSYDPQAFLDSLNKTLVANLQIESLLEKCSKIIESNIKSNYCSFFIRDTAYFTNRLIGDYDSSLTKEDLEKIQKLIVKVHKKVIYVEIEPESEEERELLEVLKRNNINLLIRIVSTLEYEVAGIGYILVGHKKSGNTYNSQDLRILEIIANELVIAIENALRFEEIEQFNVTLQKKIDDATKELQMSNEKLKALDEAKDEFVSMASHQLRTPLTSIKGYLSMVVEGDAGEVNPTQKQMLGQALFSSQRMVYLISDLLNVSRLKTGKFVIESKPTSLPEVVETELNQLYDGANAKNITLSFDKPSKFPMLNLDEMKVRQVIMNFTDNAIYYTPNGGKITVALKNKRDSIEFTVKDTGIGVPKAERHKLFAKFYRAENARKARPDGTGLGLFMAKKVIVAQGGSILFDSKEGKGSTFGFSFPKKHIEIEASETPLAK